MLESKERKEQDVYWVMAFAIPILVCVIAFKDNNVYPFGDKSIMVCDGIHQYLAFYEKLWNLIKSGDIFKTNGFAFYSDLFGVYSYYLASPFTVLIMVLRCFMKIYEAVTIAVLIKIGLCGSVFTWYISKKTRICQGLAIMLGCMYALSDYVIGYYNNLMWLDALILLPILAWGLECFVRNHNWKLYFFTLLSSIFFNYYTGYMLGVFSILYFLYLLILNNQESRREIWKSFFIKTSCCVAVSMCWMVPVLFSLIKTTAGNQLNASKDPIILANPFAGILRMNYTSLPIVTTAEQGQVNIFCGSLVLMLLILYAMNSEVERKVKVTTLAFAGIYYTALWFRPLNMFLHGFHRPIGIPNRFSFLLIFLILTICAEQLSRMKTERSMHIVIAAIISMIPVVFEFKIDQKVGSLLQIGLLLGTAGLMVLTIRKKISVTNWKKLIVLICVLDISSHAMMGINHHKLVRRDIYSGRTDQINTLTKGIEDYKEYRTILLTPKVKNEELLSNLNGMSIYSSTVSQNILTKMKKMGVTVKQNSIQYTGNSELMDLIFGVKYLVGEPEKYNIDSYYTILKENEGFLLFHNKRALKPGNRLERQIMKMDLRGKNPFQVHEQILAMAGCRNLYDLARIRGKSMTQSDIMYYEVPVEKGEHGYLCILGKAPEKVKVGNRIYNNRQHNTSFLDLGYADYDRMIRVYLPCKTDNYALAGTYPERRLDQIANELKYRV